MARAHPDRAIAEALDSVPLGVLVLDAGMKVVFANDEYRRIFELDATVCRPGAGYADLLTVLAERGEYGPSGIVLEEIMERVRRRQKFGCRRLRPNGRVLAVTGTPLGSGGYAFTFTDVTAEHRHAESLKASNKATVLALADLAEFRDTETGDHVVRVACLTQDIARRLREDGRFPHDLTDTFLDHIAVACVLHDVGKVAVPDHILHKPGRLDAQERRVMQEHSPVGGAILAKASAIAPDSLYLKMGSEIARHHHECFDGSGYPDGLAGENIPLAARIVAVADVFDALISTRPYKTAWPVENAIALMREESGSRFDPDVVDAFLKVVRERPDEGLVHSNDVVSVGDPVLDRDHRLVLGLVKQLVDADRRDDRVTVEFVLDQLLGYVTVHFDREERHMLSIGYNRYDEHKADHDRLMTNLQDVRTQFFGSQCQLGEGVRESLAHWLHEHVFAEDAKYGSAAPSSEQVRPVQGLPEAVD
jgi:hemerythrin-like metal-binding protein